MANSFFYNMKKNVVTDEEAPAYFSQRAIYVFSILFGVFFGSVLMCINLNKTETKKGTVTVVVFGILFTVLQYYLSTFMQTTTALTYILNAIGAYMLYYFFWRRYIGDDTPYRAKPIWIPSIIGGLIAALLIAAIILG